ncbi:MAG TPA: hypothetical protein VGX23_12260 [Actinocrinis sp.]|nr:hypothetical protein [Actinocrinis sp.]
MARGLRERLRRGGEPDRPLAALLADPGTVRAAAAAFDLADRPDASWWPCAALVGPDAVSLRLAGLTVPPAEAPWRAGHDARVWIADRDAVEPGETQGPASPAADRRPLLIGRFDDMVVFVDTRRAPGPVSVTGEPESAGRVRDLIDRQAPGRSSDAEAEPDDETQAQTQAGLGAGAHWPLDVEGGVIRFLGLAVATTLSASETERAIDLVRRANAADEPVDAAQPESEPGEQPAAPAEPEEYALSATLPTPRPDAPSSSSAPVPVQSDPVEVDPAEDDPAEDEPDPSDFAASAQPATPAEPAPESTPAPAPGPDGPDATDPQDTKDVPDAPDAQDDWASGFAVSSADD